MATDVLISYAEQALAQKYQMNTVNSRLLKEVQDNIVQTLFYKEITAVLDPNDIYRVFGSISFERLDAFVRLNPAVVRAMVQSYINHYASSGEKPNIANMEQDWERLSHFTNNRSESLSVECATFFTLLWRTSKLSFAQKRVILRNINQNELTYCTNHLKETFLVLIKAPKIFNTDERTPDIVSELVKCIHVKDLTRREAQNLNEEMKIFLQSSSRQFELCTPEVSRYSYRGR